MLKCSLLLVVIVGVMVSILLIFCVSWLILVSLLSSGIIVLLFLVRVSIGGFVFLCCNNGVRL